jgi:acyl-CoA synthetase (AMP-forming)/AMP-acid ligase II
MAVHVGVAFGITPEARCLLVTTLSSNGTMLMLLPAILVGAACILTHTFSPESFYALLSQQRPTHVFVVPTQLAIILTNEGVQDADFTGMRCLLSAGAPIPAPIKRLALERLGHCFYELWGLTEGVATAIGPQEAARYPQSVGRAAPFTDLRVIDANGVELQPPATGELIGRSIMMMQGYLNRPDANAEIM